MPSLKKNNLGLSREFLRTPRIAAERSQRARSLATGKISVAAGVSPCERGTVAADTAASTVESMIKDRPHRLDLIYVNQPLYFVTFATRDRKSIPSLDSARDALQQYGHCAITNFNVALGRYVIMPDHLHLFVRGGQNFTLSSWMGCLKRAMSVALRSHGLWQAGFFDHILRTAESYAEKWNYVRENPVRAGLLENADDWPYQGEIALIDRPRLSRQACPLRNPSCSGKRVACECKGAAADTAASTGFPPKNSLKNVLPCQRELLKTA